jgi:hypothetical protein
MKDELLALLKQNRKWFSVDELLDFGTKKQVISMLDELKKEGFVDTYQLKNGYSAYKFFRYLNKIMTANQLEI